MAKAKEETVEAPKAEAKKKIHVEPIEVYENHNSAGKLDVPGWVFSWQSLDQLDKYGWKIWRPVMKDTELGVEIGKQFGVTGERFTGLNQETNYFYNGKSTILAYTSQELRDAQLSAEDEKADRAMSSLGEDAKLARHVVIDRKGK